MDKNIPEHKSNPKDFFVFICSFIFVGSLVALCMVAFLNLDKIIHFFKINEW